MMTISHPLVAALYEAHVAHALDLLTGDDLQVHLAAELDADLANAAKLTLNQVVSSDLIKATARTYAVEMPMRGGIPELVGEIARLLHGHPIHDDTRLADLASDQQVRDLINKVVEMRELRESLLHEVLGNPLLIEMSSDLIYRGIKGYLAQGNEAAKSIPGASALMGFGKSMLSKASPSLEKTLDEGLHTYVRKSTEATLRSSERALLERLSDQTLRRAAMDVWAAVKHRPASDLRKYLSADSLEEFVVIAYEYWRGELRHSPYYGTLIDVSIDSFFDKYGDHTLAFLLEEIGVDRDMMLREAMRFAPPVVAALQQAGMLEGILRRQLLPFYTSGRIEAVLAAHGA